MNSKTPEYYDGDVALPVIVWIKHDRKRLFNVENIAAAILWPTLNKEFVCKRVLIAVRHNVSFLVDMNQLKDPQDILSDDMASWKNNRVDSIKLQILTTKTKVSSVKRFKTGKGNYKDYYMLRRVYRTHNSDHT